MKTYRNTAARESFAASPITCFRGDYAFLSNFYPAPVFPPPGLGQHQSTMHV